jgi:hypothetical protein
MQDMQAYLEKLHRAVRPTRRSPRDAGIRTGTRDRCERCSQVGHPPLLANFSRSSSLPGTIVKTVTQAKKIRAL